LAPKRELLLTQGADHLLAAVPNCIIDLL
jgi:hypothetical protein